MNANIEQLKENARVELRILGTPNELTGEEIFDTFFRQSKFFLQASDPTLSKNIIVIEIDGALFKFTISIPNVEAAEGIAPSLYAMLKTIEV